MPTRVDVPNRVISAIAISVKTLRIARIWDNGVRLDKPAEFGVVVAGTIVIQRRTCVKERCGSSSPLFEKERPTEKFL